VCITERLFFQIYEPLCVKKHEITGKRVKIIKFKFVEIELCRKYQIEYILKDNYSGYISFQRLDAQKYYTNDPMQTAKKEIYDSGNNVVDFSKESAFIFFDNSQM